MKTLKNIVSIFLIFGFACSVLCIPVSAASVQKGYTISSSNTRVYNSAELKYGSGYIFGSDEVTILSIGNSATYVRYPVSNGTKTGYVATNALLTSISGNSYKATAKITTYRRPSGSVYGSISPNDTVQILGKSGNYTQVKYPVSGGYKYAFVTTSDAERAIIGNNAPIANGTYIIRSRLNSNKVVDAYANSAIQNGTNIQLCSFNGGTNQQYDIIHVGNGYYKILCKSGGKGIAILNASRENCANIILWDHSGTDNELWRIVPAGDGSYYFQSKLNGNYWDVYGGYTADETNIQSYAPHMGTNQRWTLTPVGTSNANQQASSVLASNLGKINYIKQDYKTCKATSLAMALNIITGSNTETTSSRGGNPCRGINGASYRGSNGVTYVATYKTDDSFIGSWNEEKAAIDRAITKGVPAVAAVHSTTGSTKHHWILVVGKQGDDYLIVDPASPLNTYGTISSNIKSMSASKYAFGLTDYATPHYGYITFD